MGLGVHPGVLAVDIALLGFLVAMAFGVAVVTREWVAPLELAPPIDLGLAALPGYTLSSLARGLAAYLLSLLFTVVYGKLAAMGRRSERVLLPILDVLQSIPVLSFLPGLVIGLVGLFPRSNFGLELACVLAIFTSQVWNMTFSFHASLKAIPADLVEAARMNGFGPARRLFGVEIPSAMNGLLWNSMMSMAGGWFFLTVVEAFTLEGRSFRLPGLGSYMAAAVDAGDGGAMFAAVVAMIVMVVLVDQILWRPALAWAERFRNEESASGDRPQSWLYDLLRRSPLAAKVRALTAWSPAPRVGRLTGGAGGDHATVGTDPGQTRSLWKVLAAVALTLGAGVALAGAWPLGRLLVSVPASRYLEIAQALGLTALRVLSALAAGALWAIPVGVAIGRSRRLARVLQPIIQIAASFPAPMLYPVLVPLLLSVGLAPTAIAAVLMMLGTQWYVLFNAAAGAAATPHEILEAATAFRIPRWRRLIVVDLGSLFPYLVTGLVTAAGGAWNASIVSEVVRFPGGRMAAGGIGALIADAAESGEHAALAAATGVLALVLVVVNRFVWKPLQHLAATRFSLNR